MDRLVGARTSSREKDIGANTIATSRTLVLWFHAHALGLVVSREVVVDTVEGELLSC